MCLVLLDSTETIQQKLLFCVLCYTYSFYIDLAKIYIKILGILHSFKRQIPLMLIMLIFFLLCSTNDIPMLYGLNERYKL